MVSRVIPPEASSGNLPATISTALRIVAVSMLSSSTASANPTSSTSRSSSSVSTSISILTRWPAAAFARLSTASMPPATAMWLSLISMASSRPKRWLKPPPQRTAYFSRARRPGVVLRVQQMRVRVPATRRTNSCVAVATPERWPSRLSATRSAERTARAGPATVTIAVFAATASGRPEITPAARATTIARASVSSGIVAVAVMSPARPRSSASARVTAASISSGDRKASGQRRERVMIVLRFMLVQLISFSDLAREGKDPYKPARSALQAYHPLDRSACPCGDCRIDHDLLLEVYEAVENLRQRDPLHVRAEIARPHELDVGQFGLHVVGHRAFRDHDHAARALVAHPFDHAGG